LTNPSLSESLLEHQQIALSDDEDDDEDHTPHATSSASSVSSYSLASITAYSQPSTQQQHLKKTINDNRLQTSVHVLHSFTKFTNEHTTNNPKEFVSDWYVSFSDYTLFTFCHSDRFASDEILALEHPAAGSIKLALQDLASRGILAEEGVNSNSGWFGKRCKYFEIT
jgi:hypothetical protein